jgi:hypothetical protein
MAAPSRPLAPQEGHVAQPLFLPIRFGRRANCAIGSDVANVYRVSNDSPIVNAFCVTAPSVRRSFLAMVRARCLAAIDFIVRRSVLVHLRLVMVFLRV